MPGRRRRPTPPPGAPLRWLIAGTLLVGTVGGVPGAGAPPRPPGAAPPSAPGLLARPAVGAAPPQAPAVGARPPRGLRPIAHTDDLPDDRAAVAIAAAMDQIGLPYVWGGDGPTAGEAGFDCSGLTRFAYAEAGIAVPRTAHTQYYAGPGVPPGAPLRPGDLVFYGGLERVHHVGLYLGDGRMVNAPTFGKPVQVSYYRWRGDDYLGATRPAAAPDDPGLLPPVPVPVPVPVLSAPRVFEAPRAPLPDSLPSPDDPQPPEPASAAAALAAAGAGVAATGAAAGPASAQGTGAPPADPVGSGGPAAVPPGPWGQGPGGQRGTAGPAADPGHPALGEPAGPVPAGDQRTGPPAPADPGPPAVSPPPVPPAVSPPLAASPPPAPSVARPTSAPPVTSAGPGPATLPSPPEQPAPAPWSAPPPLRDPPPGAVEVRAPVTTVTLPTGTTALRPVAAGPGGLPSAPGVRDGPGPAVVRVAPPRAPGAQVGVAVAVTRSDGVTRHLTIRSATTGTAADAARLIATAPAGGLVLVIPSSGGGWTIAVAS
jgi:cell wall-associated NlpC family hydrolase